MVAKCCHIVEHNRSRGGLLSKSPGLQGLGIIYRNLALSHWRISRAPCYLAHRWVCATKTFSEYLAREATSAMIVAT